MAGRERLPPRRFGAGRAQQAQQLGQRFRPFARHVAARDQQVVHRHEAVRRAEGGAGGLGIREDRAQRRVRR